MKGEMSQKKRRILTLLAVVLLLLALAALTYVWLPSQVLHDTSPITPTYLIPPAGVP